MIKLRIDLPELFFQGETRKGYFVSSEMKKVWAIQLDLLNKLLDVCERYKLKIWADGGTLLGTVREHGYIPWDDDIDMAMLRPDYDKLISVASKEFRHPFFFQYGNTEKVWPFGHSQLRMDGTTAILKGGKFLPTKIHQGIFIDIFPYDAEPDDYYEYKKLVDERGKIFVLMERAAEFDLFHPFRGIKYIKYRKSFKQLYQSYEDLFRKYRMEDNSNVSCLAFIIDKDKFSRNKHWYDGTVYMPFESVLMPIPIGYDEILKKQYGNYMIPLKDPSYHGDFWVLDPEKSYKEYLIKYKKNLIVVIFKGLLDRALAKFKMRSM